MASVQAKDFDPQGQYKEVLQAVEGAGGEKAKIFKVQHGRTRVEYYVVALDAENQRVVGLKALAVET